MLQLSFSYAVPYLGIQFNAWRLLNLIYSVPCAISAIGLYFAYESPKYMLSAGDDDKALEILKGIYVMNNGTDGDSYMVRI